MSKSKELLIDVDLDDVPFLAMAKNLNAKLWTGDKKLIKGLKKKGFNDIVSTEDLASIKD
jgi:predicted nucleic acid-binding protein